MRTRLLSLFFVMTALLAEAIGSQAAEFSAHTASELAIALSVATPGDVLILENGTWTDSDIVFRATGTEGSPITLRARTPGKVIFGGQSRLHIGGEYLVVDGLETGGVRVIGEDHTVVGNVFIGLEGTGERAAVCLMNGLENSPLDGYFQVKRARIGGNTFDHCRETLVIGKSTHGSTLAPVDCLIRSNETRAHSDRPVPVPRPAVGPTWRTSSQP